MGGRNKKKKQQTQSKKTKTEKFIPSQANKLTPHSVIKLDPRSYSKKAYDAMYEMITKNEDNYFIAEKYHKKASGLVRSLPSYISTWGLHRLSGDASNFLAKTVEDTNYKGKVYRKFLQNLESFKVADFDVEDDRSLLGLSLREYTGLNRLAIKLAKEWSFWSGSILGEPEDDKENIAEKVNSN